MSSDRPANKRRFNWARLGPPIVSLAALFVLWRLGMRWLTIPVVALIIFYYLVLPRLVRSQVNRFNREALMLLGKGRFDEIPKLARRHLVVQLFGPKGAIDAKLALAYAHQGKYVRAITCYKSALPGVPSAERPALVAGLAKAYFVTGDLSLALTNGQSLLKAGTRLPETLAIVARAQLGLGRSSEQTQALLDEAESHAPAPDVALMIELSLIELQLHNAGQPGELRSDAKSSQPFIKAWIHLVRGLLRQHNDDENGAKRSFKKALQADPYQGFVTATARRHLNPDQQPQKSDTEQDPAVARKKRKRKSAALN